MRGKVGKVSKAGRAVLVLCLLALSVIGVLKTVFVSADIDESYTVTMACRLMKGDRLFFDMWELHQTSALLYAPFVWIFQKVAGSTIGLLVFLRVVGILIQGTLAVFLFCTCRHYMGNTSAFLLASLFFNFTPKHIQSPEYALMCCWGLVLMSMSFLQFYVKEGRKASFQYLALAAAGLCVTVLSYPAAVFLIFPVLAVVIWLTKQKCGADGMDKSRLKKQCIKNMALFTGICAAGALLFLAYVLRGATFRGLMETIPYILMDESHEQAIGEHIKSHILYLWDMLKFTLIAVGICGLCRILWRTWKKRENRLFDIGLLVVQTIYHVVQFHTIRQVNFLIFFPIILQTLVIGIYFYLTYEKEDKDRAVFYGLIIPDLFLVIAVLFSSNLTANYSMSFLFPGALAGLYLIGRIFFRGAGRKEQAGKKGVRTAGRIAVALFVVVFACMVFTSRIFLVRYTATQRLNIFEPNYEAWHGVLSGVHLGDTDYRQYEWKTASLHEHVTEEDIFLYVGADMFLYGETKAAIGTGNTISTPAFGRQLMAYYEKFPERIPTIIFLDTEYVMDYRVWLEREPFKSFIQANYQEPFVEGPLYIYERKQP